MTSADLVDLLGCAALEPDLGGILFVDLDPRLLPPCAELLARALNAIDGSSPALVMVGADTTDEQLWPGWGLTMTAERTVTIGARPGLLSPLTDGAGPLLVVADLARCGTSVTRAIVATLGTDVVHIERPGVSARRPARARWLAACAGRDLATLSPHLLDRFPVRVNGTTVPRSLDPDEVTVSELLGRASRTSRHRPPTPPSALDLLLRLDTTGQPSIRRSLALARTARAVAERRNNRTVEPADVTRAATLIGIAPATADPAPAPAAPAPLHDPSPLADLTPPEQTSPVVDHTTPDIEDAVRAETATPETRPPLTVTDLHALRPEDGPDALPEPRSLRWAVTGHTASRRAAGPIIGHERSADLRDLAVVPTLLHSLLRTWSTTRHWGAPSGRPAVAASDLRRYRRKHSPQHALVLVLDHSIRRDWDSSPGLAPHLRWAYDRGATVSVIEFGHASSGDELRPERYRTRSIADPRIITSLRRPPGSASPLAAAIELAIEELRRHMRRGWAPVRSARLVLVTDGRGNVPLEATAKRRVTTRVARQGVEDALTAAHTISGLHRVATTVIAPVDEQYPALTPDLAFALGGTVTHVHDVPLTAG